MIKYLLTFLLFCGPVFSHSLSEYTAAFETFSKKQNKYIDVRDADKLAVINWTLADGNWMLARRIAAEEGAECHLQLLAYLPDGTPTKGRPRSDAVGSHYNLLAQEAHRLGVIKSPKDWYFSDEFDQLKDKCWADPSYGTWVVLHAYVRKVHQVGLDRASHWWQTGNSWFATRALFQHDIYLNTLWRLEKQFDKAVPGSKEPKK